MIKNKIHIYRAIIILIGIFAIGPLWSQQSKVQNLITFDDKPYHFGFFLGANQMLYTIKTRVDFEDRFYEKNQIPEFPAIDSAQVLKIGAKPTLGFTIGIISDMRLGKYFNLRFTPNLQFGERILTYDLRKYKGMSKTIEGYEKRIPSTLLNFPISLKYKGMRMHNIRPYLIVGGRVTMDLGSLASKTATSPWDITIKLYRNDIYADAGVGFDFYFNWFKMSTELKMSYGIRDDILSHENEDNIWVNPIESLKSKVFQFSVTFE